MRPLRVRNLGPRCAEKTHRQTFTDNVRWGFRPSSTTAPPPLRPHPLPSSPTPHHPHPPTFLLRLILLLSSHPIPHPHTPTLPILTQPPTILTHPNPILTHTPFLFRLAFRLLPPSLFTHSPPFLHTTSVADPDPWNPYHFPGSGSVSVSKMAGSGIRIRIK